MSIASALPLASAIFDVDAREDAAIEAECVAIVNDEVVEVWLQSCRCPPLFHDPSTRAAPSRVEGLVPNRDTGHAGVGGETGATAR